VKCSLERCPSIRWGFGLAAIHEPTKPYMFLSIRFAIAAALVAAFSVPALRSLTRRQLAIGLAIGMVLTAGYVFQTLGLHRTTASNAGFLTGLYVILTPLFGAFALRKLPATSTAAGAFMAFIGLLLLAAPKGLGLRLGDGLVLACAAMFAVQILLVGIFARSAPAQALVVLQLGCVAAVTGIASAATERVPFPTETGIWVVIGITAVLASAVGLLLQIWAQRVIPPARAAVIYTMESPFAAIFGIAMLGEHLTGRGWVGAALILGGMLVAELLAPVREEL
jgi:drug/metabolite transporter (DMT)-like permease